MGIIRLVLFLCWSNSVFFLAYCKLVPGLYCSPFVFNLPVTLVLPWWGWKSPTYKPTAECLLCNVPWFYYLIFSSSSYNIYGYMNSVLLWNIISLTLLPGKRRRKGRGDFISIPWYHALNVIHCANNCISMFISWCAFNCFTHSLIHMK